MRALLTALVMALPLAAPPEIARPDDIQDTLTAYHAALIAAGYAPQIDRADVSLSLATPDGGDLTSYPDNLHAGLQQATSDAERQNLMDTYVASIARAIAPPETISGSVLLPVLRAPGYFALAEGEADRPQRDFTGDVSVFYVADYPTYTSVLTDQNLRDTGIAAGDLDAVAMNNLADRSAEAQIHALNSGAFLVTLDGYYESSLMLMPNIWDSLAAQNGPLVAIVPNRDILLYAPLSDGDAVAWLAGARQKGFHDNPYPVSNVSYLWDGQSGRWQVFAP